ncbi:hypothetical protein [Nonomuraea sp. NPDC049695]|uniref:hypothetical protein n=1 Tax=Nonomuraea sp. NPDC049695 TaxID=3154734 RepID=UPI0034163071
MRRYRFGRIAARLAAAYVAVVIAFGVVALVTREPRLLLRLVAGEWGFMPIPAVWWVDLVMVAVGAVQGWALWQVLRGRATGELTGRGRWVALLRVALYASVASSLLFRLPIPYAWWQSLVGCAIQLAVVWLYFPVLAGVLTRWWRLLALAAGTLSALAGIVGNIGYGFELTDLVKISDAAGLDGTFWMLWFVLTLVGQARDARWSRGTVWIGALVAVLWFLTPSGISLEVYGDLDYSLLFDTVITSVSVFGIVWDARSAHELANPVPSGPSARVAPERAPSRSWPLAAVAVALPLIPAAVNLAQRMPLWIGPRGAVESFVREHTSELASTAWVILDVLVGVGAPAVLVLVAVVRRTRRLLRVTMTALSLAAVAGAVSALTYRPGTDRVYDPDFVTFAEHIHPEWLLTEGEDGRLFFGISPLWYSFALAGSALILFLLYAAVPARRRPHYLLAVAVALCAIPAADLARGPVTTAKECDRYGEDGELAGPRAFVCAVRDSRLLDLAATTPDQVLLAHGRRLCAVYTRNDPKELAHLRLDTRSLTWTLAGICPSADAAAKALRAAQDREFAESQAEERRKCDAAPRHRPLIKPAKSTVLKEPEWPEIGWEMYEETEDGADPADDGVFDRSLDNGLVAAGPSHLVVMTDPDYHVCVALETYARRPPVETKGWEHVVEVGYESPSGQLVLSDGLGGGRLPDLSLHGRKGHYRIRVHYAWLPGKGEEDGTQRLLIMAYPAPGDKVITYRKPARRP